MNPNNNLAHCFKCHKNLNNIDLLIAQGHNFLSAVEILEKWLKMYQSRSHRNTPTV